MKPGELIPIPSDGTPLNLGQWTFRSVRDWRRFWLGRRLVCIERPIPSKVEHRWIGNSAMSWSRKRELVSSLRETWPDGYRSRRPTEDGLLWESELFAGITKLPFKEWKEKKEMPLKPPIGLDVDFAALRERRKAHADKANAQKDQIQKDLIAWGATFFGGDVGAIFNALAEANGITPNAGAIDRLAEFME